VKPEYSYIAARHRRLACDSPVRHVRCTCLGNPSLPRTSDTSFPLRIRLSIQYTLLFYQLDSLSTSLPHTRLNKAPAPLPPSNCTNQRLQYQALYGIELLDWLMRRAYTKSPRKLATRRDRINFLTKKASDIRLRIYVFPLIDSTV